MAASQKSLVLYQQHPLAQACSSAIRGCLGLWAEAGLTQHGAAHACHENDMKTEELEVRPLSLGMGPNSSPDELLSLISCPMSLRSCSSIEEMLKEITSVEESCC